MLQNKRAVITGGSEGIGFGIAQKFIANGAEVLLIGRSKKKLEKAKQQLGDTNIRILQADLSCQKETLKVSEEILQYWDEINILVNNAGMANFKAFEEVTQEERETLMSLNVDAPFVLTQKLLPALKKLEGNVINIGSYFANKSLPNRPASIYAMSKGAIHTLTKSLAYELGKYKIRVNAIAPGTTHTPLVENALAQMPTKKKEIFLNSIQTIYPLGRLGEIEDIGALALFLASTQANWITGSIIHADGGLTTG